MVKSCYATPFCGWSIASVKKWMRKTALQLALCVLRVLVSPNHIALSCSPLACVLLSRWCDSGTHTAILIVSAWKQTHWSQCSDCVCMRGGVYWNRPVLQIKPSWAVVFFRLGCSQKHCESQRFGRGFKSLFSYIFSTFRVCNDLGCGLLHGGFLCGEWGVYGSGPISWLWDKDHPLRLHHSKPVSS